MRRACDQCLGTDTQYECERGHCYAQHYQQQQRRHEEDEEDQRRQDEAETERLAQTLSGGGK